MISIYDSIIKEYDILHFNKRAYTSKYPQVNIPKNLSKPAIRNIIKHLKSVLSSPTDDKDKFDGTKQKNYDEKVNMT